MAEREKCCDLTFYVDVSNHRPAIKAENLLLSLPISSLFSNCIVLSERDLSVWSGVGGTSSVPSGKPQVVTPLDVWGGELLSATLMSQGGGG